MCAIGLVAITQNLVSITYTHKYTRFLSHPDSCALHGLGTGNWKFIFSCMAGFLKAAALSVLYVATAALLAACSAAFSRSATCSRSLLLVGSAVTTALNAAAAADVGMADTSLHAMLRKRGVVGVPLGGFATSISSGTSTWSTAACRAQHHTRAGLESLKF